MSLGSVRNRLFTVIAGMALLSSLSIAAVYVATEAKRADIQVDGSAIADLYDQTVRLSNAIRDEEAAIDDYLLVRSADAKSRFTAAVQDEFDLEASMRQLTEFTYESPGILEALNALAKETQVWRDGFAQPAIAAVESGSKDEIATLIDLVASGKDPALAGVDNLIVELSAGKEDITARDEALTRTRAVAVGVGIALMLLSAVASLFLARCWVTDPLARLLATAGLVEDGADMPFVTERDDEIGRLGHALEAMRTAL